MEITKAFDIICSKTEKVLVAKGYTRQEVVGSDNELMVLYIGEPAYSIIYYVDKQRVQLRCCGMDDGEPDNDWKTIATWLFDPQVDTEGDAENIGNDFAETISGPRPAAAAKTRKKSKKDEESTSDPLFFANRMINYFPQLRDDIAYEKAHYESFRGTIFADEKIMPLFRDYVNSASPSQLGKLSKTLSDLYDSGDLDVKGIITYVLFNSIDDDRKFESLIEEFPPENRKIAMEARKLRGKKIKPEKITRRSKFIADTLNAQQ